MRTKNVSNNHQIIVKFQKGIQMSRKDAVQITKTLVLLKQKRKQDLIKKNWQICDPSFLFSLVFVISVWSNLFTSNFWRRFGKYRNSILYRIWNLALVVQKQDSVIYRINLYRISPRERNCVIHWIVIYPPFEQLGIGLFTRLQYPMSYILKF